MISGSKGSERNNYEHVVKKNRFVIPNENPSTLNTLLG